MSHLVKNNFGQLVSSSFANFTLILILGDPQYFFDGNQTDQHGCKCKQDNSCKTSFGSEFGCNCNSRLPEWNIDKGTISGQSLPNAFLLSTINPKPKDIFWIGLHNYNMLYTCFVLISPDGRFKYFYAFSFHF